MCRSRCFLRRRWQETAARVSDFLVGAFDAADPKMRGRNGTENIRASDILDKAARSIDEDLSAEPRVRARLRRVTAVTATGWCVHGRFGIDEAGHRVKFDEVVLDLTRYEYGLLLALLARPGAVLTRAQLMDRVWEDAPESGDRTVDTHVKTVRAKLRDIAPASDPIRTVRGIGYAVEVGG